MGMSDWMDKGELWWLESMKLSLLVWKTWHDYGPSHFPTDLSEVIVRQASQCTGRRGGRHVDKLSVYCEWACSLNSDQFSQRNTLTFTPFVFFVPYRIISRGCSLWPWHKAVARCHVSCIGNSWRPSWEMQSERSMKVCWKRDILLSLTALSCWTILIMLLHWLTSRGFKESCISLPDS